MIARERVVPGLSLVLSGGAYKVMFQIAFLWFLEKAKIYPEKIYAISGGVPNALALMLKKASQLPLLWFEIEPSKLYSIAWFNLLVKPLVRGKRPGFGAPGILKTDIITRLIDREVNFSEILLSPITLWIGVEDYISGSVQWVSNHDRDITPDKFRTVVLASMRIPIFFEPINEGEAQLADAGFMTNIPIGEAIRGGANTIIAINALPRKLPKIKPLETWPEIETRNSDAVHIKEGERHRQAIEETNQHIRGIASIKSKLCRNCLENIGKELDSLPRSRKRFINFCLVNTPMNLTIFKKETSYGSLSLEARFELLGASIIGTVSELIPFLSKVGLLESTESLLNLQSLEEEFKNLAIESYRRAASRRSILKTFAPLT